MKLIRAYHQWKGGISFKDAWAMVNGSPRHDISCTSFGDDEKEPSPAMGHLDTGNGDPTSEDLISDDLMQVFPAVYKKGTLGRLPSSADALLG